MNERKFCQARAVAAILQSESSFMLRATAVFIFAVALVGCGRGELDQKITLPLSIGAPAANLIAEPNPVSTSVPAEPQLPDGSGVTVWADKFENTFIAGLDGQFYMPYTSITIERVQKALRERGLYIGPANGILDRPTMNAIYLFQQANANLGRCGIPTPRTRHMLDQGSHTDPRS